jgi:hypothetical protein
LGEKRINILRVFPKRNSYTPTDPMVAIGDPGFFRPPADEVHISIVFTRDIEEGKRLQQAWSNYYPIVKLGGPAFGEITDEFVPGVM